MKPRYLFSINKLVQMFENCQVDTSLPDGYMWLTEDSLNEIALNFEDASIADVMQELDVLELK